jgi:peptidyl-prolyl cis-trans isomerase C
VRSIAPIVALIALVALGAQAAGPAKDATSRQGPAAGPAAANDKTLIATVNGKPYRLNLFRMFYTERLQAAGGQQTPEFRAQVLDQFMTLITAAQEATKLKLQEQPDVQAALEVQRLEVLSNAAIQALAKDQKVSEDEIKKAYAKFAANAKRTQYKARHILVKTKGQAEKLIKQLGKGADFAKLAKENSMAPNATSGGELGWVNASQIPQPLAETLDKLKPGSYAKEPVMTQFGWHVVELEDSRKTEPPSLDSVKPELTAAVKREKAMQEIVKRRDAATVEFNPDIVKTTPKAEAGDKGSQ